MSQEHCWECGESFPRDKVFDIPIFTRGWTVKWCFNCAMKQLKYTDFAIVQRPEGYKEFKIESIEDSGKKWMKRNEEIILCYERQIRKLKKVDEEWAEICRLTNESIEDELEN